MQLTDLVNGLFELGGALINGLNVRALIRDRGYSGVHWSPWAWFSAWGLWNLYYYPHLGQYLSFMGGCGIVFVNLTWLGLAFYYGRKDVGRQGQET